VSPVARDSIKAASIISGTVATVTLMIMLLTLGAWGESKADKEAVQDNRERVLVLENQEEQNTEEHYRILLGVERLEMKIDRALERIGP